MYALKRYFAKLVTLMSMCCSKVMKVETNMYLMTLQFFKYNNVSKIKQEIV